MVGDNALCIDVTLEDVYSLYLFFNFWDALDDSKNKFRNIINQRKFQRSSKTNFDINFREHSAREKNRDGRMSLAILTLKGAN